MSDPRPLDGHSHSHSHNGDVDVDSISVGTNKLVKDTDNGTGTTITASSTPATKSHPISNEVRASISPRRLTSSDIGPDVDRDREQRIVYLRQAFCGFFKARTSVEMQHLGRVICAILGLDPAEQGAVMDSVSQLSTAWAATSAISSFSSNISSLFG